MFFVIVFYPCIKIMNSLSFSSDVVNLKSTPSIIDSIIFLLIFNSSEAIFFLQVKFALQVLDIFLRVESLVLIHHFACN